jgi:micrococcal nuclease
MSKGTDIDDIAIRLGIILLMLGGLWAGSNYGGDGAGEVNTSYVERSVSDAESWAHQWKWICRVQDVPGADEVICNDGVRVRLIGLTAPAPEYGAVSEAATTWLRALLPPGTRAGIELDEYSVDPAGRVHAYLRVGDGKLVNEMLLREGVARRWSFHPNTLHEATLNEAAGHATARKTGLWPDEVFRCFATGGTAERCTRRPT